MDLHVSFSHQSTKDELLAWYTSLHSEYEVQLAVQCKFSLFLFSRARGGLVEKMTCTRTKVGPTCKSATQCFQKDSIFVGLHW